jgi:CheY-like chemotaxis protein/HPt (histidine-containing phosphotransfer) domain-containing protein
MGQQLPLHILLAEDNATNQKLALRLLARMGYRADVVANGLEAVEALKRQPYDVVLMDIQMPEMDGLEATRHVRRELPDARQPRVIAMTANAMQGDREMCLAAGMDDYVSKPIRVEELVNALSKSRPLETSVAVEQATPGKDAGEDGRHLGGLDQVESQASVVTTGAGLAVSEADEPQSPSLSTPALAVLDPGALEDLLSMLGGEFDYLVELIDSFLEDAPKLLSELGRSVDGGDAAGVRRVAHSLKSNGADFGATGFSSLCKDLEMMGKSGTTDGAAALFAQVMSEYERVEAALAAVRREGNIPD